MPRAPFPGDVATAAFVSKIVFVTFTERARAWGWEAREEAATGRVHGMNPRQPRRETVVSLASGLSGAKCEPTGALPYRPLSHATGTSRNGERCEWIDYIWHSSSLVPAWLSANYTPNTAMPNVDEPSDHLPLCAGFTLRRPPSNARGAEGREGDPLPRVTPRVTRV